MNRTLGVLVVVLLLAALTVSVVSAAAPTQDGTPVIEESNQRSGPIWLGLVLLGAPAVFMVWRARNKKEADKITMCGCLPVIDEDKRPFAIQEDEPAK